MDVLSIPVVLQTIFQNLDNKGIAKCRLVNTNWNHEAVKILECRVLISFHTCLDIDKFIDTFQSSFDQISISFQNFYFSSELFISAAKDFPVPSLQKVKNGIQAFVYLVGNEVLRLVLVVAPILMVASGRERYTTVMYKEMLEIIYNYFPNLQSLKLLFIPSTGLPLGKDDEKEDLDWKLSDSFGLEPYSKMRLTKLKHLKLDLHIPQLWGNYIDGFGNASELELRMISAFIKLLLTTSVNLQSISCSDIPPHPFLQHCLLRSLSPMSPLLHMKALKVPLTLSTDDSCDVFCSIPNLESAHLEITCGTGGGSNTGLDFKEFFSIYRLSLRHLHLSFSKSVHLSLVQLPWGISMKKLTSLTLEDFKGSIEVDNLLILKHLKLLHSSLNCITSFPNRESSSSSDLGSLETLEIVEGTLDKAEEFPSMLSKVAAHCLGTLRVLTLTRISSTLPLQAIFKECKKLKSLTIQKCGGVSDQSLCGISDRMIRFLCPGEISLVTEEMENLDMAFQKMIGVAKSSRVDCIREFPFIGDLKDLQFLKLDGEFSDVGVLYGIINCEKLIRLNLVSLACTWRSSRIIQQASLLHLTCADVNGDRINLK